jgi:hypothetical protein
VDKKIYSAFYPSLSPDSDKKGRRPAITKFFSKTLNARKPAKTTTKNIFFKKNPKKAFYSLTFQC